LGFLALTVGILLLLTGLLSAALLLAGLLTRVLVLLARVLVLIRTSGSPLLKGKRRDNGLAKCWFRRNSGSAAIIAWRRLVATVAAGTQPSN